MVKASSTPRPSSAPSIKTPSPTLPVFVTSLRPTSAPPTPTEIEKLSATNRGEVETNSPTTVLDGVREAFENKQNIVMVASVTLSVGLLIALIVLLSVNLMLKRSHRKRLELAEWQALHAPPLSEQRRRKQRAHAALSPVSSFSSASGKARRVSRAKPRPWGDDKPALLLPTDLSVVVKHEGMESDIAPPPPPSPLPPIPLSIPPPPPSPSSLQSQEVRLIPPSRPFMPSTVPPLARAHRMSFEQAPDTMLSEESHSPSVSGDVSDVAAASRIGATSRFPGTFATPSSALSREMPRGEKIPGQAAAIYSRDMLSPVARRATINLASSHAPSISSFPAWVSKSPLKPSKERKDLESSTIAEPSSGRVCAVSHSSRPSQSELPEKYARMLRIGMSRETVHHSMIRDGIDGGLLL